jgi:hypothetical protein
MMARMTNRGWTAVAVLAGIALRVYFIREQAHVLGDSLVYGDLAGNLLRHHTFGLTEGATIRPTMIRLPGYPLFLAVCFAVMGVGNYAGVLYVQMAMDLGACLLVAALAARLMGPRAGMCALWLGMLCPFMANYVAAPLTETPAIFCAALAFYTLQRWREDVEAGGRSGLWAACVALAVTGAVLLRPDRILLAAAALAAMLAVGLRLRGQVRLRALGQLGAAVGVLALALGMWTARNWKTFHVVQPLAPRYATDPGEPVNYGFQRWYKTWAVEFESTMNVYWNYDGAKISVDELPPRAFDSPEQRAATEALIEEYNGSSAASPELDAKFAQLAAQRVRAHPVRYYVAMPVLRMADMWLRPRTEMLEMPLDWWRFKEEEGRNQRLFEAGYAALNAAYLVLAAVGLWRWKRLGWGGGRAVAFAMVGFVALRTALLLTLDNSEPRYTMDCYPVVIVLAAFALWPRSSEASERRSCAGPS